MFVLAVFRNDIQKDPRNCCHKQIFSHMFRGNTCNNLVEDHLGVQGVMKMNLLLFLTEDTNVVNFNHSI